MPWSAASIFQRTAWARKCESHPTRSRKKHETCDFKKQTCWLNWIRDTKRPKWGCSAIEECGGFTKYVYEVIQMGGLKDLSCKEWVKSSKQNRGHAWPWVMNPTYRTEVQSDAQTKPKCSSILYVYTYLLHDAFDNEMFEFTQVACVQHISKTTPYLVHIQILQVYLP